MHQNVSRFLTCHVMHCIKGEALQINAGTTSEQLSSGGFESRKDKKEKEEENGDFRAVANEEPEQFLDHASKNTPEGSNQEGMDP